MDLCQSFLTSEELAEFLERYEQHKHEHERESQAKFQRLLGEMCRSSAVNVDSDERDVVGLDRSAVIRDEVEDDSLQVDPNKSLHLPDSKADRNESGALNESGLYEPPTSPFSENDDDDRAIRADAAIIREREEATEHALQPSDLYELGESEEEAESSSQEEHFSLPSSSSSSDSVGKLLSLKLNASQLQFNSEKECQDERNRCLTEDDVVKARYRGSAEYCPAKVTFCHTHDLFDLEYNDGDQNTLVPRDAIRLISKEPITDSSTQVVEAREEPAVEIAGGITHKQVASFPNSREQPADMGTPAAFEPLSLDSTEPLYALDDAVEANFLGMGKFHRGRVVQCHEDDRSFDIQYTDFEEIEARVPEARIRVPVIGKSSSRDLLAQTSALSSVPGSARSRKSTSTSLQSSLRSSVLSPRDAPEDRVVTLSATSSRSLVVPSIPEAANAKRVPLKSTRPLTTSSSSRSRSSQEKQQQLVPARKGVPKASKNNVSEISWRELEEWKNVDLILNRKRRFLNSQSGSVESVKVPWGGRICSDPVAQALHDAAPGCSASAHLEEVGAANRSSGSQSARTQSLSSAAAGHAREALLLVKDLSFLLKQRLSPFLVLPAVFNAKKRFLCDIAYEVLEALVLHCSGRRLVLLLLEHGEECVKCDDVRLLNLTSVYVEKCFLNLNTVEIDALMARSSVCVSILTSLANLLLCKAAPSKIAAQKSLTLINTTLHVSAGTCNVLIASVHKRTSTYVLAFVRVGAAKNAPFERMVRAALSDELASVVLRHTLFSNSSMCVEGAGGPRSPTARSPSKLMTQSLSPVVVHQGMSILQRMVVQRQNRVVPAPE